MSFDAEQSFFGKQNGNIYSAKEIMEKKKTVTCSPYNVEHITKQTIFPSLCEDSTLLHFLFYFSFHSVNVIKFILRLRAAFCTGRWALLTFASLYPLITVCS